MDCKHSIGIASWPYDGWIHISDGDLSEIGIDDADNITNSGTLYLNDYCPNCGAKLEIMQEKVGRKFLLKNIAPKQNSMSIENAKEMLIDFANSRVAHTSYFSDIDHRNDVLKFFEEWRKNNDC